MSVELEKVEKASISKFDFLKETGVKQIGKLKAIVVKDETSEAIASQQLSNAAAYVKEIEAIRIAEKKEPFELCTKIDSKAKELSIPVQEAMAPLKQSLLAWKDKVAKEAAEKLKIAQEIQNKIIQYQSEAILEIGKCNTHADLAIIFKKRITEFPADEVWGEYVADAKAVIAVIKSHGSLRNKQIKELETATIGTEEEVIQKQQIETAEIVVETTTPALQKSNNVIAQASITKPTGTRKTAAIEVINIDAVPREFMSVDEAKVMAYFKAQVAFGKFAKGVEVVENGIKYYYKTGLIVKS